MIEILIAKVFATRNAVHLYHWKTKSYAQHVALGDLYEALISNLDAVVECHQGAFNPVKITELPALVLPKDIIKHLEEEVTWIELNAEEICQSIEATENLLANLTGSYFTTIYKLKNLS